VPKIIFLQDVYDIRRRKQDELAFYHAELDKLKAKMFCVQKEIDVTNVIIRVIEDEEVVDLRDVIKNRSEVN